MSAPTLLVAVLMLATTRDPPRGACEAALAPMYEGGGSYKEVRRAGGHFDSCTNVSEHNSRLRKER